LFDQSQLYQRKQRILEDLFGNDDDEYDYIKNQPIFESTQIGIISFQSVNIYSNKYETF